MIALEGEIEIIDCDETLKVYREGIVTYVDGKPVKLNKTCYEITCNVQPLGGRDLLLVPEGDRYKESYVLFIRGMPAKENDRVTRCGKNFQLQTLEPWGSYQRAIIILDDVGVYSND